LGLAVVARVHRWIESAVRVIEYAAFAFPQFWIGLLLVFIFGFRLGWFPVLGGTGARALVLPACALSLGNAAVLSRTLRASLAEQMQSGYVVAARALGIRERRIRIVHVLPLAIIPVVAILAIQAGYLLAGTIVIEQVFGLAGLGQLAVTAVAQRDVPLVQGTVVVFAIAFPVLSMIGEIVISGLWPRMGKRR
jgi:peptide/nickel transport system permease protein